MNEIEANRLFKEANDLWFYQGLTNLALERYRAAVKSDPTNPTLLYQLGCVLSAFSRFEEAQAAFEAARSLSHRMSPRGKELLAQEIHALSQPVRYRLPLSVTVADLDVAVLEYRHLSRMQWLDTSDAAGERGMYGVAAFALDQGSQSLHDRELAEDERAIRRAARVAINRLNVIGAASGQTPEGLA